MHSPIVSPGFSGNASDRFIVENSGFIDKLKAGQRILADRGFTARDLLARKQPCLTVLSFLGATTGSPYIVFISTSGMLHSSDKHIYIYI